MRRPWFRRYHRWLGGIAAFFVLLLAVSGIALNHGHSWKLDRNYVTSNWLLSLYGIEAPPPSDSYSADGKRATLIGETLFFENARLVDAFPVLNGMVSASGLLVLAADSSVTLATPDGELVDRIDLEGVLPGPIQRLGVRDELAIVQSDGAYFIADSDLTGFEPAPDDPGTGIDWADATPAPDALVTDIQRRYLEGTLTWERLILDLHSGRIAGSFGVWFMDFIAISLVVLSVTGLFQWRRRNSRR